jgi:hypothetical protein
MSQAAIALGARRMGLLCQVAKVSLGALGVEQIQETLLDPKTKSVPSKVQYHLAGAQLAVLDLFRTACGNLDGFPEVADPQDSVYLPIATRDSQHRSTSDVSGLPSISIVVPSLNQARFLGQALQSILNQNYPNLEIRVHDGGSSDGSVELLQQYEHKLTHWVSEPDRGPAHAINKGFAGAKGEILGWLNSDDVLAEGALAAVGRAFAEDPELDMVYANALSSVKKTPSISPTTEGHRLGSGVPGKIPTYCRISPSSAYRILPQAIARVLWRPGRALSLYLRFRVVPPVCRGGEDAKARARSSLLPHPSRRQDE